MKMRINENCFKLDRPNAKALIHGFVKDGNLYHQSIYCAVSKKDFPMLITFNKTQSKFPLSKFGDQLYNDNTPLKFKYIAELEKEYFISNKMELWNELCNNGLFDIWLPIAPFNRFKNAKADPSKYRILLLRIYEIEEELLDADIHAVSDRVDKIIQESKCQATIRKPVIDDISFNQIKNLLEQSLNKFKSMTSSQHIFAEKSPSDNSYVDSKQTISERNLENIIVERLEDIEPGLKLKDRQLSIPPAGRIDILCTDKNDNLVVIELKKYDAPKTSVIDQITAYMGYVGQHIARQDQIVRGIIICGQKDAKLNYSASAVKYLEVKTFKIIIE